GLGGGWRWRGCAYASGLMPDAAADAERMARDDVSQGCTAVRLGWGPLGRDEGLDVELIAAARSGAGCARLMIDIGQQYTVKQAIRVAKRVEKHKLYWMEEALPPDDFDGYRRLAGEVTVNIAAGEAESSRRAFRRL